MFNVPRRPALTRAGIGAALVALVAIAGYNIGLAQSPSAMVSAAQSAARPVDTPRLKGLTPRRRMRRLWTRSHRRSSPFVSRRRRRSSRRSFPTTTFSASSGRELPRQPRIPRQSGLGSGVLTTTDGYILTNNHVIDGADQVRVELPDKRVFDAKVVGADPASDLAVLKIERDRSSDRRDGRFEPRARG